MPLTRRYPSLRQIILANSGQDVRRCRNCAFCNGVLGKEADIPLESVVTMIILNDEEVLSSRTVWSDQVLDASRAACTGGIDMYAVLQALREEAQKRGIE